MSVHDRMGEVLDEMVDETVRSLRTGEVPPTFPLSSFREAATHLRRPFTPAAVKFKVQATWPKDNPTGGLIVAYIDARLVVERLNLLVPDLWQDDYEPLGKHLVCRLTVDGITRQDIGEGVGKGLYSDALKRAAVKFGVGVSLYAIPKMLLKASDGHLKQKTSREGPTMELTPNGETRVRNLYAGWLSAAGCKAFGDPLDHGDVEDAVGDVEEAPSVPPTEPTVTAEDVAALKTAAKGLPVAQIKLAFSACGLSAPIPFTGEIFAGVPSAKAAELAESLAGIPRPEVAK